MFNVYIYEFFYKYQGIKRFSNLGPPLQSDIYSRTFLGVGVRFKQAKSGKLAIQTGKLAIWQISKVRAERYYWKTHPIINLRIFGHDTDRISGKLIQNHAFSRKIYFTDSRASYEITVLFMTRKRGKRRIRHKTTLKLNFKIDPKSTEDQVVKYQSRSVSDPSHTDIDFIKNDFGMDYP